ncbi:ribosome maturation factor RimP [Desulfogranum japonicum]|uniref:ribosome maturation factor RimP n=1 Tax=Desulfogranum japonicum TaxID=231447 RepID=UPI00040DEDB0|nr:ribosome maturation factor [Desulfogranum japonicum]
MESVGAKIVETIEAFAGPLLEDMGLELVEIQFRRENHGWVLRFFIDKQGGVTIDDCANVSREVSAYLEVEDLIDHAYHLEVSSPGAERPLKTKDDFKRFVQSKARIKMREPIGEQKVFVGIIQEFDGDAVLLEQDGRTISLDFEKISRARLAL